jgi:hypothetical protein
MNTVFVAIDGDNIGQQVGQSVLHDDPSALAEISQKLTAGLEAVRQWTEMHQGQVISLGGDEGTLMFQNIEDEDAFLDEIENLRQIYLQTTGATMTAGSGSSLSQAGKALLAGKLSGKDMIVPYGEEIEHILHDAHQHVLEGEGTEEEQKQDDHYISHIDGIEDDYSDESAEDEQYSDDQDMTDQDMTDQDMTDQDMGGEDESSEMPSDEMDDSQEFDAPDEYMGYGDHSYMLHHADQGMEEDQDQDQDLDQGDFDYNPDDYQSDSDELPEEEMEAMPEDHGDVSYEDQTMEGMDGGAEEMAGGAPYADDEEDADEFSSSAEDMQGAVDNVMGSPEDQEESAEAQEEEEPIEIPENENMESADDMESEELPMESDEMGEDEMPQGDDGFDQPEQEPAEYGSTEADPSVEMDAFNQILSESGQDVEKMKSQVAATLSAFKEQKDALVAIQEQAPELYEATLAMLQTMLDLSKAVFGGAEDQQQPEDMDQEEPSPDIQENIPMEQVEQEPAPKF